jgi:hypothetical protein
MDKIFVVINDSSVNKILEDGEWIRYLGDQFLNKSSFWKRLVARGSKDG